MQSTARSPQLAKAPEKMALNQTASGQAVPEQVEITLLLTGGQEYTLSIPTQDLLLRQLFEVVMDWEGKRTKRLFQIPIQQGRAMLTFSCDRLVGLITNPPLIIQQPLLPVSSATVPQGVLISNFVQVDQFLHPDEQRSLLNFAIQQESAFVDTNTATGDRNHRQSLVLYQFPEFSQLITKRLQAVMPQVFANLKLAPFPVTQIESQLTAHNDGHYYRLHNDNGSPDTALRELTYVYYFNREPKAFSGGELKIYDSRIENNFLVRADSSRLVEPRNNSIVFFPSCYMHEVLPIQCPSRQFAHSRFTVNGWISRP